MFPLQTSRCKINLLKPDSCGEGNQNSGNTGPRAQRRRLAQISGLRPEGPLRLLPGSPFVFARPPKTPAFQINRELFKGRNKKKKKETLQRAKKAYLPLGERKKKLQARTTAEQKDGAENGATHAAATMAVELFDEFKEAI